MLIVVVFLIGFILGWVVGILARFDIQARTVAIASPIYKELVLRGDAAIAVLSKVKEKLAETGQGKRVVLAEDLAGIRRVAGVPEATKVEAERKIKVVG